MRFAVDLDVVQLRNCRNVKRQDHRRSGSGFRLLAAFAVTITAFALCVSSEDPARAHDSLETMEGGLFHRKGWIDPEIYPHKAKRPKPNRSTRKAASSSTRATQGAWPCTASPTSLAADIETREPQISHTTDLDGKSIRVASLTSMVPSLGGLTGPEISITDSAPCVRWVASSRCIPERLHAAINHVALNYGRVRVNSTCRSPSHNRRVGGARHSFHLRGRAADIRVFGNIRGAARYLRRVAGGYKHYGGGLFHIDTGPKRSW
jgi:hypothetical protein